MLHLKILDDFIDRSAVNEQENQHAYNSNAYQIINRRIAELPSLVAIDDNSRRYEGPESLVRHGLLRTIDWSPVPAEHAAERKPPSLASRAGQNWLATLPPSGLIWNDFDEYNELTDVAFDQQVEVIRCRGPLAPGEVGLICVLRNEVSRLPLFFEHYKKLGIDRFFMVDNRSNDGSHEVLLSEPQADIFLAHAAFTAGNTGLYWANALARKYCSGNWLCISDADELLVYDEMERKDLADLGEWLGKHGQDRLFSIMVDIYPSGSIGVHQRRSLEDILVEDCWFDSEGYSLEPNYGGWLVTGGPRHRVFNRGREIRHTQWISKYPFFHMQKSRAVISHHWLWPMDWRLREPQGALLHLKLMDDFIERSARYEREGQHALGSRSYQLINERMAEMPEVTFFHANSRRYRGPKSLVRHRIMQSIDWGK